MKVERSKIVMADGTEYYANMGIIGLNEDGFVLTHGYDGGLHGNYEVNDGEIPSEHRREIAEYMIALWTRYLDSIK